MNVFTKTLQLKLRSTITWAIVLFLFIVLCLAKFQTITGAGGGAASSILTKLPSTVQAIFGMSGLDVTAISGYFGVCLLYILVLVSIQAGLIGGSVIGDEEQQKVTEFLYTKPRSRASMVSAKLCAGFCIVIVMWLVIVLSSVWSIHQFSSMKAFGNDFWPFMLAIGLTQILAFSIGSIGAAASKRVLYGKIIAVVVAAWYLLYTLSKLSSLFDWMRYLTPFRWFDALDIVAYHALSMGSLLLTLGLSCLAIILTYVSFRRRDLRTR